MSLSLLFYLCLFELTHIQTRHRENLLLLLFSCYYKHFYSTFLFIRIAFLKKYSHLYSQTLQRRNNAIKANFVGQSKLP